jgi:hypothetical protein
MMGSAIVGGREHCSKVDQHTDISNLFVHNFTEIANIFLSGACGSVVVIVVEGGIGPCTATIIDLLFPTRTVWLFLFFFFFVTSEGLLLRVSLTCYFYYVE